MSAVLEIKDLSVNYGTKSVLRSLSVAFEKGKLTTVIGVNGSGKSTLLKASLGILPHQGGEIFLDGTPLSQRKRTDVATKIAYLSQGNEIPDMTAGEAVLHGRFPYLGLSRRYTKTDRRIAREAMERLGIEASENLPLSELSGGQRQIVYLARALAQQAEYILLDEPTTYLDLAHQWAVLDTLRTLADGGTGIVAVLHDLPTAFARSDEIVLLDSGTVCLRGNPRAVADSAELERVLGVKMRFLDSEGTYLCTKSR